MTVMPTTKTASGAFLLAAVTVTSLLLGSCGGESSCRGEFTVDMAADTPGAADPMAALQDWLDGTSPVGAAPAGAPDSGWEEAGGDATRVGLVNGDWQVTVMSTTNGEWIVWALVCG